MSRVFIVHYEKTGLDRIWYVESIDSLPFKNESDFTKFYKVYQYKNDDSPIMYLAKGYSKGSAADAKQIVPFYINGSMCGGYGLSFAEAVKLGFDRAIFNMKRIKQ